MARDCPSMCQDMVDFGNCMSGCEAGAPCVELCAQEWDPSACLSDCEISKIARSRVAMTIDKNKVKRHMYLVPAVSAVVLIGAVFMLARYKH
jgi:hypothetical protein